MNTNRYKSTMKYKHNFLNIVQNLIAIFNAMKMT